MRIPKKYGSYQTPLCPFCSRQAIAKSAEGVPVCSSHKDQKLPELKCGCGEYVDLRDGKWGPYFSCIRCGNVNFSRIIEMNVIKPADSPEPKKESKPQETTARSDELDFLD